MGEGNVNTNSAVICVFNQDNIELSNAVMFNDYSGFINFESDIGSGTTTIGEVNNEIQDVNIELANQQMFIIENSTFKGISDFTTFNRNNELNEYEVVFLTKNFKKLDELKAMGNLWDDEGINPPNELSITLTKNLLWHLAHKKIFNYNINPTIEEGILLSFRRINLNLFLELYNDGQFGYIIEDFLNKETIENRDLNSITEATSKIEHFLKV